jgi:hypothetical protein
MVGPGPQAIKLLYRTVFARPTLSPVTQRRIKGRHSKRSWLSELPWDNSPYWAEVPALPVLNAGQMARDKGLEELVNDSLAAVPRLTTKAMFGGLAWLVNGNLLCGPAVAACW